MLSSQTDQEVFQALQAGNQLALGILYDRYGKTVYYLALRILGNATEAEDLTQEVFLIFWRNRNYDPQRGSIGAFLITMTRSRAIDRLRKVRSQQQFLQKLGHNDSSQNFYSPMEKMSLSEIQNRVRLGLQQLPEVQRQVLEMAYYDGMSQSEINQHLDIPLGTVKTRTRQGLIKLRQILRDLID